MKCFSVAKVTSYQHTICVNEMETLRELKILSQNENDINVPENSQKYQAINDKIAFKIISQKKYFKYRLRMKIYY